MISPADPTLPAGFRFALDNGAWSAFQTQTDFNEAAFLSAFDRFGALADWCVLPDIVAGGLASLNFSLGFLDRCRGAGLLLIAVQNGMRPGDVSRYLGRQVGIFIGGDTQWKEETAAVWGGLAADRGCYLHMGRVNSQRRIRIAQAAGCDSVDGSGPSRFCAVLPRLDSMIRQGSFSCCVAN